MKGTINKSIPDSVLDNRSEKNDEISEDSFAIGEIGAQQKTKLPTWLIWVVCVMTIAPMIYNLLGGDAGIKNYTNSASLVTSHEEFASHAESFFNHESGASKLALFVDHLFYGLPGAFWHVILEWSAIAVAFISAILAFAHYRVRKNFVVPFIGVVMLCAGTMDLYHTLAAARLIDVLAPNSQLIPFTWAEARIFNALGFLLGAIMLLFFNIKKDMHLPVLIVTAVILLTASLTIAVITSSSEQLPPSQFPNSFVTRPYDVFPLIIYLIMGLILFPILNKRSPSIFYSSLVLSMVPQVAAQIYMSFYSGALFDNGFNIGHGLKTLAYLVPCVGIIIDYVAISEHGNNLTNNLEKLHKKITDKVNASVSELKFVAEQVGHGAVTVSSSSSRLSKLVEEQFEFTTLCASAMEEMTVSVSDVSVNTRNVAESSQTANKQATLGSKTVTESIDFMSEISVAVSSVAEKIETLNRSSQKIADVISSISGLADQTNLLALNAAIEAARAGEHGRGFSVVADEVRGLASKTQLATNQITVTVEGNLVDTVESVERMRLSMNMINKGTESAAAAKANMEDIVSQFSNVAEMVSQIAVANEQQSEVARDISQQLNRINEISSELVETIKELSVSAEALSIYSDQTLSLASDLTIKNGN